MNPMPRSVSARFRRAHRFVVPIAAAPLLLTAASGSLYSLLLERGIDAFWLLKIHTGRFGPINLQPYYPEIILLGDKCNPLATQLSSKEKYQEPEYENHGIWLCIELDITSLKR